MKLIRVIVLAAIPILQAVSLRAEDFISFDFSLSPDVTGNLNGRIDLGFHWTPWLSSEVSAYTDNYTQPFGTATDISTLVSTDRTLRVTALRIDEELLWLLLGARLGFIEFSAGFVGIGNWTTQKQYGYDPSQPTPLFYLDSTDKTSLRPLQSYSLGIVLGPVSLTGSFESTIVWAIESVASSHYDSSMPASPAPTATAYQGGDTRAGGELSLNLGLLRPIAGFEYFLHVMTDGTVKNTHMSETYTYHGAIVFSFLTFSGGSPEIGVSYVQKKDFIVASAKTVTTDNIRIEIGLQY